MECDKALIHWQKKKLAGWTVKRPLDNKSVDLVVAILESQTPRADTRTWTESYQALTEYFKGQTSKNIDSDSFHKLYTNKKVKTDAVAERTEKVLQILQSHYKTEAERINATKYILETGVHSIQNMTRKDAEQFMKKFKNVYTRAKAHIDQGAKAIGDDSQQIGAFLNNASLIAKHTQIPDAYIPVIQKMISIKAMSDEAWTYKEKHQGSEAWNFSMSLITDNKRRTQKLFAGNPDEIVNNYSVEVYDKNKYIDENGKVKWDGTSNFEQGAIPVAVDRKKVGRFTKEFKLEKPMSTKEEAIEYALANNLKMSKGQGFREVLSRDVREEAGRSMDFTKILSETTGSIDHKEANIEIVNGILKELNSQGSVISSVKKDGFRALTDEEVVRLPYQLQGKINYVNKRYDRRLLGRDEVRLYNGENHVMQVADRIWADNVRFWKTNVVVKNPKSHINAVLVNQAIGSMAGMAPNKLVRYQREASKAMKKVDELKTRLVELKSTGKDFSAVQKELDSNLLYQMEQEGLAVNLLEGTKHTNSLASSMFTRDNKLVNELSMGPSSKLGTAFSNNFTRIDTQGRYALAKHFQDKGDSLAQAVHKANGLFADMDVMSPHLIELADKYGGAKFLKWFTLSTPMLMQLTKEKPALAIALGVALYVLQEETNTNFSTVNPIEAVVDFPDAMLEQQFVANAISGNVSGVVKTTMPYVLPKVYMDAYNYIDRDNYDLIFKDRLKDDYRGVTQKIVEETIGYGK